MRLAIFGNGRMGQLVRSLAEADGHEVAVILSSRDAGRSAGEIEESLRNIDATIDFSVAEAVYSNVSSCVLAGIPLVEGTTGWNAHMADVRSVVEEHGGGLIYGANFSIGANLFYRIVARAAELFHNVEGYAPFIEEAHHVRKR